MRLNSWKPEQAKQTGVTLRISERARQDNGAVNSVAKPMYLVAKPSIGELKTY